MQITDINQLDLNKTYSYADYRNWRFDDMVELIKGKIFRRSPAPGSAHQWISGELHFQIKQFLKKRSCQVFSAPFDVRLPLPAEMQSGDKINTIVQPDICIICDLSKLDSRGYEGAPDWIIEILSKSTSQTDLVHKFDIYQNAGVKEYWIIHPAEETVLAYALNDEGQYKIVRENPFVKGESLNSFVFPNLVIPLAEVFPDRDLS